MGRPAREYRSYAEFEREELFRPRGFVQTLDDFHDEIRVADEDIIDLFDSVDDDEDEEEEGQ